MKEFVTYKPKKLVGGFKIGKEHLDKTLVAVPKKKFGKGLDVKVICDNEQMIIPVDKKPLKELAFQDKFSDGMYILQYFEWKAEKLTTQIKMW